MNNSKGTVHASERKITGKSNSDEQRHQQIYKNLLIEFRECELNVIIKLESSKKLKGLQAAGLTMRLNQKNDISEPKQEELNKIKSLLMKKDYQLSYSERQYLKLVEEIYPNLVLIKDPARGYYSISMLPMNNFESLGLQTPEMLQEVSSTSEKNGKDNIFEKIVRSFRIKYDKEYKKQIEKNSELLPFQEQNKFQSEILEQSYWEVLQGCYRVLGTEYMKKNNVKESLKFFQAFKMLCDKNRKFSLKMLAYKEIGFCYNLVKQYRSALINFKKLLQLAWYRRHKGWELKSYDYIGITYYYLGELEKSKYYHKRMWESIYESENSAVRIIAVNALKQKMENRVLNDDRGVPQIKLDTSYVINQSDEEENDLPSPRTGSGEENLKLLPFYVQKKAESNKMLPYLNHNVRNREASHKNTTIKSLSNRVRSFMLISHLSPNESPNNYFYVEQMGSFKIRGDIQKHH